jgi:hypothetical protein
MISKNGDGFRKKIMPRRRLWIVIRFNLIG